MRNQETDPIPTVQTSEIDSLLPPSFLNPIIVAFKDGVDKGLLLELCYYQCQFALSLPVGNPTGRRSKGSRISQSTPESDDA